MRIAEFVNSLEIGGAERLLVDLAVQLKSRGHTVEVICLRGQGPLAVPLQASNIDVTSLGKADGFRPGLVAKLTGFLRNRGIDVVHTHNPLVHHYGAVSGRLAGVPVIVNTLHGFGNLDDSRKTRTIYDLSCLFSTCVVSVCRALDTHLRKVTFAAGRKSVVVPNGIALERFLSIKRPSASSEFLFGAVGRLAPVKDHRTLLRAFALLVQRHPQARLEILGDGPLHGELQSTCEQLGIADRVRLVPTMLDVAVFLARLHTFVMSSLTEGLPLTLLEAMAAAVPVVATQVGAMPEIVQGAKCGWLVPAGNPVELAATMERAMQSRDREVLAMQGRRYALQHHSLKAMTDQYESLFSACLTERRALERPLDIRVHHPRASSARISELDRQLFE